MSTHYVTFLIESMYLVITYKESNSKNNNDIHLWLKNKSRKKTLPQTNPRKETCVLPYFVTFKRLTTRRIL